VDSFLYDLRHAARGFARRPGFVAVGVFSLALGIAGVPEPDRLIHVGTPLLTPAQVETLRDALAPTGDVFASAGPAGAVSIGEVGQRAPLEIVSGGYFDALGLRPAVGRLLGVADASAGDVARAVVRRSREIGVRMALGASPAAVVRLVLRSSGGLALAGVALGVPAAFVAQGLLRAAIFGLPTLGAGTLAAVAALVVVVTAAASYVPVRRATRVDPAVVLRAE
jgi:hypothetical protein